MKSVVIQSGGLAVLADSFGQSVFKESFRRVFTRYPDDAAPCDAGHLTMGFAGTLEVVTSPEYKITGAIGPCSSLKKKSASVSETEVGAGGTYAWRMGGLSPLDDNWAILRCRQARASTCLRRNAGICRSLPIPALVGKVPNAR